MADIETYIIWACVLAFLFLLVAIVKLLSKRKAATGERTFILSILAEAAAQKSTFDLKLKGEGPRTGLVANVEAVSTSSVTMHAHNFVADYWDKKPVEAYFRVNHDGSPVFFVFDSNVLDIAPGQQHSDIQLALPAHLRVEKKRHFIRVQPEQEDILALAVWDIAPGRRLPRANADLGRPALSWKTGQPDPPVEVENISAAGIALRFAPPKNGDLPVNIAKGRQILCLLVYRPEANAPKPVIFMFTGEIMNTRKAGYATSVGLEFTNWAVQEQGEPEIHWTHSSPWKGVKLIHEWVSYLDHLEHPNA